MEVYEILRYFVFFFLLFFSKWTLKIKYFTLFACDHLEFTSCCLLFLSFWRGLNKCELEMTGCHCLKIHKKERKQTKTVSMGGVYDCFVFSFFHFLILKEGDHLSGLMSPSNRKKCPKCVRCVCVSAGSFDVKYVTSTKYESNDASDMVICFCFWVCLLNLDLIWNPHCF